MTTDIFPEYSDIARDAIDLFLFQSADAIFYFEDSNHEAVYERLVNRIFPKASKIQIVCLGGKTKVIAKARVQDQLPVRSLFVLDKDFDDLLGKLETIPNLYYLNVYSLENYFLQLNALLQICVEERPTELTLTRARTMTPEWADFMDRLQHACSDAARLFIVARRFRVEIESTKMRVDSLLTGAETEWPIPTTEWIRNYREELKSRCHGNNEWLSDDSALDVQLGKAFLRDDGSPSDLVDSDSDHLCGKHLLGCVRRYLRARLAVELDELDNISFYIRLVGHLDLSPFERLRRNILADHPILAGVA